MKKKQSGFWPTLYGANRSTRLERKTKPQPKEGSGRQKMMEVRALWNRATYSLPSGAPGVVSPMPLCESFISMTITFLFQDVRP